MSLTIHNPEDVAQLRTAVGALIEVHGPDGTLLGKFTPAPRPGMMYPELGVSDAELRRRADDSDGWVTSEVVEAKLRELRGVK
jgi:hypothetical protein